MSSKLCGVGGVFRLFLERFRRARNLMSKPDESIYQFGERRVGSAHNGIAAVFTRDENTVVVAHNADFDVRRSSVVASRKGGICGIDRTRPDRLNL